MGSTAESVYKCSCCLLLGLPLLLLASTACAQGLGRVLSLEADLKKQLVHTGSTKRPTPDGNPIRPLDLSVRLPLGIARGIPWATKGEPAQEQTAENPEQTRDSTSTSTSRSGSSQEDRQAEGLKRASSSAVDNRDEGIPAPGNLDQKEQQSQEQQTQREQLRWSQGQQGSEQQRNEQQRKEQQRNEQQRNEEQRSEQQRNEQQRNEQQRNEQQGLGNQLSFDMEEAFWEWERAVGCKAFREKHKHLIDAYTPPNTPSHWPTNPSLQALSPANCTSMKRQNILVFVSVPAWMEGSFLEEYRLCPRCGVACEFTLRRSAAWRADAHLFVRTLPRKDEEWWKEGYPEAADTSGSSGSNSGKRGAATDGMTLQRPLVVMLNLEKRRLQKNLAWCYASDAQEADRLRKAAQENANDTRTGELAYSECPDIVTDVYPDSDVQLTYASFSMPFKAGQNLRVSTKKNDKVPLHRSTSNCGVQEREELAGKLLSAFPHHSFGGCLNSFDGARREELKMYPECRHVVSSDQMQEVMRCVRSRYKLDLAFENSFAFPGYVTEKFFVNLEAGTVPIYYGAEDIHNFAPPESFIDVRQFNSTQDLISFIKEVDSEPVKYMNFHAWRHCKVWGRFKHSHALGWAGWPCRLCEKVASMRGKLRY